MAVTETVTESWGSRLGASVRGMLLGLAMFVAGFPFLFWNEGNTIKTAKALEEGEESCIAVSSPAQVDPSLNDKLVHMTGLADTACELTDAEFGVTVPKAIRLTRKVEMYQWEESSKTTEKKNMGGSVTKTTTYTYAKIWADRAIDSSGFKEQGHDNPGVMEFEGAEQGANLVMLGAFRLSPDQIQRIGGETPYVLPQDYVCPVDRVKVAGSTIYVPNGETRANALNQRDPIGQPRIGDMRVSFTVVMPHEISVVARQYGDTFVKYTAKNGKNISLLSDGVRAKEEMFAAAQSANSFRCWLFRLIGFLLMYLGISSVLKPISVTLDVLPFLGNIAGVGIGIVSFAVAAPCALVTIAVAWLFYRPVLAIALLVAAGAIVFWFIKRKNACKPAAAPAAETPASP